MKYIDIGSNEKEYSLSNFEHFEFYVDGVFCCSMEGFLQSLKFEDQDKQIEICKLVGVKAKFKGKKKKWFLNQKLYWKGEVIDRHSERYQDLLDIAFSELFKNKFFKNTLMKTKGFNLIHSIGKENKEETILTVSEFCSRLTILREYN